MKVTDLRQKSKEELSSLFDEKRSRADELYYLLRQKKTKNVKELANIKKDIARIITLLKELNQHA